MVYHHRTELVRLLTWRLRAIINQTRPVVDDIVSEDAWFNQEDSKYSYRCAVNHYRHTRRQARKYLKVLGVVRQDVEATDFEFHTIGMIKFVFENANQVWED